MSTKKKTATRELDERAHAIEEAKARINELEAEKRTGQRDLDRALGPFQDYYRQVEAGEREPDPAEEEELQAALNEAQSQVAPHVAYNPRAEHGAGFSVELVNPRLDGLLAGARDTLARLEAEYELFLKTRFADLVAELAAEGRALVDRYGSVASEARKAHREWGELRNRWRPLCATGAFGLQDIPPSPFSGMADVPLPIPRQLTGDEPINAPRPPKVRRRAA